jgi:AraC family transcriptional regulator
MHLVGLCREMSQVSDETSVLWREFGPRKGEIANRASTDSISMRVYPGHAGEIFDPVARIHKWAAVEVLNFDQVPAGMSRWTTRGGLYAIFVHEGSATDLSTFEYIFGEWLPNADFDLDHREHFEILPLHYDPFDPRAREEICVPITMKTP